MILDLTFKPEFAGQQLSEQSIGKLLAQGILNAPSTDKVKMLDIATNLHADHPFEISLADVKTLKAVIKVSNITVAIGGIAEKHLEAMIENPHKYEPAQEAKE